MHPHSDFPELLGGRLVDEQPLPLCLQVRLCDLRPRLLPKCKVGRGYRAIARNGRVLLAADATPEDLVDATGTLRMQIWHRAILPGDLPEPCGILLCFRRQPQLRPSFRAQLARQDACTGELIIVLGGRSVLQVVRT